MPNEMVCYLNQLFSDDFGGKLPPQPECNFDGYVCYSDFNTPTTTECTSR